MFFPSKQEYMILIYLKSLLNCSLSLSTSLLFISQLCNNFLFILCKMCQLLKGGLKLLAPILVYPNNQSSLWPNG